MVRVLLVKVVFGLGAHLRGELLEDGLEHVVDGVLLGGVAVPDGDEVGVEANGEAYAAELVVYFVLLVTRFHIRQLKKGCVGSLPSSRTLCSFSPMANS